MSDDYYFCKMYGLEVNTIYEKDPLYTESTFAFSKKMYVYGYKFLNLVCYDISESNLTEKGQRRWILTKS